MNLREQSIRALQPYIDVDPAIEPNEWGLAQRHLAGVALDALLDCLEANAPEWADFRAAECDSPESHKSCPSDAMVVGLIAALRDTL